ncbi:unannotated protein [freshwater metagenome]|uniref:Unannotated protein n=1 Tax=freshwater metagenome TaxID=449393 RepID=A0A6J7CNU3_9ZZZZ
MQFAASIAINAPSSIRAIRATQRGDLADRVEAAMAHERALQARLFTTADFAEGVAAMAQRRDPRFTGL